LGVQPAVRVDGQRFLSGAAVGFEVRGADLMASRAVGALVRAHR
jgi:hypothetical protein